MSEIKDSRSIRFLRTLDGTEFSVGVNGVTGINVYSGETSCSWVAVWGEDKIDYRINMHAVAWFSYIPEQEQ